VLAQPFLERIDFNTAVFPWDYNAVTLNHRLTSPSFRYADHDIAPYCCHQPSSARSAVPCQPNREGLTILCQESSERW
jgi:hypothetical protein